MIYPESHSWLVLTQAMCLQISQLPEDSRVSLLIISGIICIGTFFEAATHDHDFI